MGAVLGGKTLRRKAMVGGAVVQSLPDIDFLAGLWCDPAQDLLAHRGFTHSFLFVAIFAPLLAMVTFRRVAVQGYPFKKWTIFFAVQLSTHLLLDALNVYGTGWWEPFSHHRVSGNLLFVADPLLTFPLLLAAGWIFFKGAKKNNFSFRLVAMAFLFCIFYLVAALFSKWSVNNNLLATCHKRGIKPLQYFTTPAPFTSFLWYYVVSVNQGFYVGYHSVFDRSNEVSLHYVARQDSLLQPVHDREDVQHLRRFSKGYYALQWQEGRLVFNDLRFGQQMGWVDPKAPFSFYYYLDYPGQNDFLIQRGRIAGWSPSHFYAYLSRIVGKK